MAMTNILYWKQLLNGNHLIAIVDHLDDFTCGHYQLIETTNNPHVFNRTRCNKQNLIVFDSNICDLYDMTGKYGYDKQKVELKRQFDSFK